MLNRHWRSHESLETQPEVLDRDAAEIASGRRAAVVTEHVVHEAIQIGGVRRRVIEAVGRETRVAEAAEVRDDHLETGLRERLDVAPPDPLGLGPTVDQQERISTHSPPHERELESVRDGRSLASEGSRIGSRAVTVRHRPSLCRGGSDGLRSGTRRDAAGDPVQQPPRPRSGRGRRRAWRRAPPRIRLAAEPRRLAARGGALLGRRSRFGRGVRRAASQSRWAVSRRSRAAPASSTESWRAGPITATGTLAAEKSALLTRLDADGKVEFQVDVDLTDGEGTSVAQMSVDWHVRRN